MPAGNIDAAGSFEQRVMPPLPSALGQEQADGRVNQPCTGTQPVRRRHVAFGFATTKGDKAA